VTRRFVRLVVSTQPLCISHCYAYTAFFHVTIQRHTPPHPHLIQRPLQRIDVGSRPFHFRRLDSLFPTLSFVLLSFVIAILLITTTLAHCPNARQRTFVHEKQHPPNRYSTCCTAQLYAHALLGCTANDLIRLFGSRALPPTGHHRA